MAPEISAAEAEQIGTIENLYGSASATTESGGVRTLSQGDPVYQGDKLLTGADSAIEVKFLDGTLLSQAEKSVVDLDTYVFDPDTDAGDLLFKLAQGTFRMATGAIVDHNPDKFKIQSPLATIGIRGTVTGHFVPYGGGEENHGCLGYDNKPVVVQSNMGGPPQTLYQAGMSVGASAMGLGSLQPYSAAQMTFFTALSPESMSMAPPPRPPSTFSDTQAPDPTDDLPVDNTGQEASPQEAGADDAAAGEGGGEAAPEGGGEGGEEGGGEGQGEAAGEEGAPLTGDAAEAAAQGEDGDPNLAGPEGAPLDDEGGLGGTGGVMSVGGVLDAGAGAGAMGAFAGPGVGIAGESPSASMPGAAIGQTEAPTATPVTPPPTVAQNEPTTTPPDDDIPDDILQAEAGNTGTTPTGDTTETASSGSGTDATTTSSGSSGSDSTDSGGGGGGSGGDLKHGTISGDTADFSGWVDSSNHVYVNLNTGSSPSQGVNPPFVAYENDPAGDTTESLPAAIVNIIGTIHCDSLFGNDQANTIDGLDGDEYIQSYAGADVLIGRAGSDTIYAGPDGDILFSDNPGSPSASDGNDSLYGEAGADTLYGSGGTDTYEGGADSDVDILSYQYNGQGTVSVPLTVNMSTALNGSVTGTGVSSSYSGIDHIQGSPYADTFNGSSDNDTMSGMGGSDLMYGNDGNDLIFSDTSSLVTSGGNDSVYGGAGDDTIWGSTGTDLYDGGTQTTKDILIFGEDSASGADPVGGAMSITMNAGSATDGTYSGSGSGGSFSGTFTGFEVIAGSVYGDTFTGSSVNNEFYGQGGNDTITGAAGDDNLNGGMGNDTLSGDAGNNVLMGGGGADSFLFGSSSNIGDGFSVISDFSGGVGDGDKLVFDRSGCGGANAVFEVTNSPSSTNPTIYYESSSGYIYYDQDGSGGVYSPDHVATLTNSPVVTTADAEFIS